MKIEDVDKNFAIKSYAGFEIEWHSIREFPFKIYGLMDDGHSFFRMPIEIAQNISDGVRWLNTYTAGGRVRFATDSPYIAISVKQPEFAIRGALTVLCSAGFDIYCDEGKNKGYVGSFTPDCVNKSNERVLDMSDSEWEEGVHSFTLNFPLYCAVNNVYIGVKKGSVLKAGLEYKNELPIVYYGSSITQGASASRSGMCYQNIICRLTNVDYINLGFSGSAKGEKAMAEYIKTLPMSVFVYDYDYNAPDAEFLRNTHESFLRIIKENRPELPVIMLSRPCCNINDGDNLQRRQVIIDTYNSFKNSGDENVFFIDGSEVVKDNCFEDCLVDYVHPNDIGLSRMASSIFKILENLL